MSQLDHEKEVARISTWIFALTMAGVLAYAAVVFAWVL